MYKEKLKKYLKMKNKITKRLYWFDNYIKEEDLKAIDKWNEEECKKIYEKIKEAIEDYDLGYDASLCPFCIKHENDCLNCEYAKNHDICDSEDSDFSKLTALEITSDVDFTNIMYRYLLLYLEGEISENELWRSIELEIKRQKIRSHGYWFLGYINDFILDKNVKYIENLIEIVSKEINDILEYDIHKYYTEDEDDI